MHKIQKQTAWWIFALIGIGVVSRLIPHMHNFTPLGGIALFSAAYIGKRHWSLLVPLFTLWISDVFLNNFVYSEYVTGWNRWFGFGWSYLGFAMIVGLGWLLLQKINLTRVLGSALTASVLFFLLSNFGVWLGSTMYPPTGEGLMLCYAAGIPFFWKSVLGTVGFSLVFFSTYEWATSHRLLWEKA
ncbi:MAG: DUF6580 family putative transport protein [Saprospiraceae bacterium]